MEVSHKLIIKLLKRVKSLTYRVRMLEHENAGLKMSYELLRNDVDNLVSMYNRITGMED